MGCVVCGDAKGEETKRIGCRIGEKAETCKGGYQFVD